MLDNAFIWAIIGIVLLAIVIIRRDREDLTSFVQGILMFWVGIAALITAVAKFVLPGWDVWQLFSFTMLAVAGCFGVLNYIKSNQQRNQEMTKELTKLNQAVQLYKMRAQIVGQRGVCIAIGETHLRIRVNGVEWYAWADGEIAVDDEIVVIRLDGTGTMPIVRRS